MFSSYKQGFIVANNSTADWWLRFIPLLRLYSEEGIDISLRKTAEALNTTHPKLIKDFGTKVAVLKQAYFAATIMHFLDALDRPRYSGKEVVLRKAVMLGQILRSMSRYGYGSISMQLWAREKYHYIIRESVVYAIKVISERSTRSVEEISQNLFDGGIVGDTEHGHLLTDQTKVFIRTGFVLFMSVKGIDLMKTLVNDDNLSDEYLSDVETSIIEDMAKFF